MKHPSLRLAEPRDAAALDAAGYAAAMQHYELNPLIFALPQPGSSQWSQELLVESDQAATFVAEVARTVVGFARALLVTETRPMLAPSTYGKVESLAVLPAQRGQGVGTALLKHAELWLRERGCSEVRLNVWVFNSRAVELYAASGYEPVSMFMAKPLRGA